MKKFNINHYVYVKLNEKGKAIVANDPIEAEFNKPDENGFYKFQMWKFMKLFSAHLGMLLDVVSEENCIYFNESDFIEE